MSMLPRELYAPPGGENVAQMVAVSYIDGGFTREEIWSTECESDAPRKHERRVSRDNGRRWSEFETIEDKVNVQRPDGGIATSLGTGICEPPLGILFRVILRRLWPGMKLYTYAWGNHEHPFNDHVFVAEDDRTEKMLRYEDGPDFSPENPFDPAFCAANRAYPGSGMAFARDGTVYYPIVSYKPGRDYSFNRGGVRVMRREPATGEWIASEPQYISPEVSSRGLLEPDVALLRNGALLVVCRGSDTPETPGRKWMCMSTDGGRTLSPVEELRYDGGSRFYSPSSIHRFFRSSRNGRLYWIANIVPCPPRGNSPRYPLCIAEIDEERPSVVKDSIVVVDDRREGEPDAVQLSNWSQLENRETLDWEFYLTRIGESPQRFWESGVYRYTFSPPS
jgi:hypothetical protein